MPLIDDDDTNTETDETFTLRLSDPAGANFGAGKSTLEATGTIEDDGTRTVSFAQSTYSVNEGETRVMVDVLSSVAATQPIVLTYTTEADTASATTDFIAVSNTDTPVSIGTGQSSAAIFVNIKEDSADEGDEAFKLKITAVTNASLEGNATIETTITIIDDDNASPTTLPVLSFKTTSFSVSESIGHTGLSVELELDRTTTEKVVFAVGYVDQTAENGKDFIDYTTIARISAGKQNKTIVIPIINDDEVEEDQTFDLVLSNLTGAKFSGGVTSISETVTIEDDESLPTLTIAAKESYFAESESDGATFTLTAIRCE